MATDDYLRGFLASQDLSVGELNTLRELRQRVEARLSTLDGHPRFYYGGSFGKSTMIRERYDLDVVVYWPTGSPYTLESIYEAVGARLRLEWQYVNRKTVAWEVPFTGGFHIDVVPGRALDAAYYEANLYRSDTETSLKTSLKKHIDTVRGSGRRDAIRLMKLWRERQRVPFKKSFLLELMTIQGSTGKVGLEQQLLGALTNIRDNIVTLQVKDPANSNNSLSDDIPLSDKRAIRDAAQAALDATTWDAVFD